MTSLVNETDRETSLSAEESEPTIILPKVHIDPDDYKVLDECALKHVKFRTVKEQICATSVARCVKLLEIYGEVQSGWEIYYRFDNLLHVSKVKCSKLNFPSDWEKKYSSMLWLNDDDKLVVYCRKSDYFLETLLQTTDGVISHEHQDLWNDLVQAWTRYNACYTPVDINYD